VSRRKMCRFCIEKIDLIDFRDVKLLQSYIPERGKILPRRISGTCARHQRMLADAIKRARIIGLTEGLEPEEISEGDSQLTLSEPLTVEELEEEVFRRRLRTKTEEVLTAVASALERMEITQEEIELLKMETRAMLTELRAA
jgi:small subunit ribosomal protein S18